MKPRFSLRGKVDQTLSRGSARTYPQLIPSLWTNSRPPVDKVVDDDLWITSSLWTTPVDKVVDKPVDGY